MSLKAVWYANGMKLIILYGAPAAGKLTIATELRKIADVQVFHNHQVINMIEPFVTRKYSDFDQLIYQVQHEIIIAAAKANQANLVFTFAFASNEQVDVTFLTNLISEARAEGAETYPIFLRCDAETLRKRVVEPSRARYGKVSTVETMNALLQRYDFTKPLEEERGSVLRTDELTAAEAAQRIKRIAF